MSEERLCAALLCDGTIKFYGKYNNRFTHEAAAHLVKRLEVNCDHLGVGRGYVNAKSGDFPQLRHLKCQVEFSDAGESVASILKTFPQIISMEAIVVTLFSVDLSAVKIASLELVGETPNAKVKLETSSMKSLTIIGQALTLDVEGGLPPHVHMDTVPKNLVDLDFSRVTFLELSGDGCRALDQLRNLNLVHLRLCAYPMKTLTFPKHLRILEISGRKETDILDVSVDDLFIIEDSYTSPCKFRLINTYPSRVQSMRNAVEVVLPSREYLVLEHGSSRYRPRLLHEAAPGTTLTNFFMAIGDDVVEEVTPRVQFVSEHGRSLGSFPLRDISLLETVKDCLDACDEAREIPLCPTPTTSEEALCLAIRFGEDHLSRRLWYLQSGVAPMLNLNLLKRILPEGDIHVEEVFAAAEYLGFKELRGIVDRTPNHLW